MNELEALSLAEAFVIGCVTRLASIFVIGPEHAADIEQSLLGGVFSDGGKWVEAALERTALGTPQRLAPRLK